MNHIVILMLALCSCGKLFKNFQEFGNNKYQLIIQYLADKIFALIRDPNSIFKKPKDDLSLNRNIVVKKL